MSAKIRFALGFVIGLILTGLGVTTYRWGHGTYIPRLW